MQGCEQIISSACRSVTADEIAHYTEYGWAKLTSFVAPDAVRELLTMAQGKMGVDAQGNPVNPVQQPFFNPEATDGLSDPLLRALINGVGHNARALMQRRPGVGVRYFGDFFAAKLPAGKQTSHPGAGATYFHQDFMNWAVDRSGGMTFWVALTDLEPQCGTMSFLSGSQRMGVLGHYHSYGEGDLLDDFPELRERCLNSGPLTYAAGDATVHSNLTVHGAGVNSTDVPRWAWLVVVNPSDARWNGGPPEAFDTTGMQFLQLLDDARFPVIG